MDEEKTPNPDESVDPADFLRALLHISPEDAEAVRERTPGDRKRPERGQHGPTAEYGDEDDA